MKTLISIFFILTGICSALSQSTQTIRGRVTDKESSAPLIGCNITVPDLEPITGTISDLEGYFKLDGIPVGRHNIEVKRRFVRTDITGIPVTIVYPDSLLPF